MLFQDEPDETEGPALFQNEPDELQPHPLQDEPDEPDEPKQRPIPARDVQGGHAVLFQEEPDEDSASDTSGFEADGENEDDAGSHQQTVQLNFDIMTKFLESKLCRIGESASQTSGQILKKRRYNNENRANKAAKARAMREQVANKRIPRDDPDTQLIGVALRCCI